MNGVIKTLVVDKGFGFIRADNKDYFFHRTNFNGDFNALEITNGRLKVTFDAENSQRGPRASNVTLVEE